MVTYDKPRPYLKRIPIIADATDGILRYDYDNLYPQRAEEIIKRSYTLNSVMARLADFLNGEGFSDPNIAKLIVNESGLGGQSFNSLLTKSITPTFAKYNTICLHIGYNLNYRMSSIRGVKFEYLRLSDYDNKVIKYSTNWEYDGGKRNKREDYRNIITFNRFNPDPLQVQQEIEAVGGIEHYKGQILYFTPEDNEYPLASFDPVFDHAQAQGELGAFKVANIQNAFLSTIAIIYPGEFESETDRGEFRKLIENKTGARNASTRIGLQDKTGLKKASDIFQNLSPTNLDKLYEFTESSVMEAIMENEAFPKEILGVQPESGMFNQENMEQAYTYVNAITRNRRAIISEVAAYLLKFWEQPILTDASIIPQRYIQEGPAPVPGAASALEINDNLKNMTGMQAINFARILRKYSEGKHSRQEAEVLLRGGFGLSEEEIAKLLDGIDADKETEGTEPATS
jgi:hypothetical protein